MEYGTYEARIAKAIVDEMIARGVSGGGGGGGGGGDASATNQQTQITRLEEIRSRLDDLKTYTDGLEGYTDQLEGFSLIIRDRLPTALSASGNLKTAIAESLPGGENFLGAVGGRTTLIQTSFIRPADTTVYAVGDSISNSTTSPSIITFANAARVSGGSGVIVGARLAKSTNVITNANFRLWLYTATSSNTNDNAALSLTWANRADTIGYIDFSSPVQGTDYAEFIGFFPNSQYAFKSASGISIFGKLQALGAYTPGNAEQFFLEISVLQD